jgi:integrase
MVFRRGSRPSWYFQGKTRSGWEQLCAFTPDKRLGEKIEAMWADIADKHRAWDVLGRVLDGSMKPSELYDLWLESGRNIEGVRRRLSDTDVEPLVEQWSADHAKNVEPDSAAHALTHVRWLVPESEPLLASAVTPEWLERRLAQYGHKRNTRRKVHSSWSVFFEYATRQGKAFDTNPMAKVARPKKDTLPIRFYEARDVERIVGWFAEPSQRAYFALVYGTGMDVSDALPILRGDLDKATHEVRAFGTKNETRDRVAMIADWAWPIVWEWAKDLHTDTRLFPDVWSRWTVSDWHRQAIGEGRKDTHGKIVAPGLNLPRRHPLKCARHHWAVRMLRAGVAVRLVADQLGHATTQQTLDVYGRFTGLTSDRKRAEKQATKLEQQRRKTEGG